ncbi:MAG: ATP-binding cassette domain-containing protein, partial [Coxiellaceae bacterium]|nr:ATP-binding cassette domain-containing protein [Coxiellaceae bacterium]
PSELSGGQKQRVAIARALATNPTVLLCDEATSALDPQTTHRILQLLKNINEELGVSMMLITHEMSVVKEICHRLAIMEQGKIVEQAKVLDFFANPQSTLAKEFIRNHIKEQFPDNIAQRLEKTPVSDTIPLLRLSFVGRAAEEPLIAHLMRAMKINLNILLANIETIRDTMIGTMVLEADGDQSDVELGIQYLLGKGVNVEVIGYVRRTH